MEERKPCETFVSHAIRKVCKKCRCEKEEHVLSESDVKELLLLLNTLNLPEAIFDSTYAWKPSTCADDKIEEFFKGFDEDKVPKKNTEGEQYRLKQLIVQLPMADLSINYCRYLDSDTREEFENHLRIIEDQALRLGIVMEWVQGMPVQCPRCLSILEPNELVVLSTEKGGPAYHPTCFICSQCEQFLVDLIHCFNVDGKIACIRHFSEISRKRCHTCDELIFTSQFALAGEKHYHKDHILCFACDKLLKGSKGYEMEDELYCAACYEERFCSDCIKCEKKISLDSKHITFKNSNFHYECFTCNQCSGILSDKPFEIVEEAFYCCDCYDEKFAPRCGECKEIFDTQAKVVKYEEKIYHVPCFKCVDCKDTIGTGTFVPQAGFVYCKNCHLRNFGVRCCRCHYTITDEKGIMFNKQPYHEECFTCYGCSTSIAAKSFKNIEDERYCLKCYGEKFCKVCYSCERPILLGIDSDVLFSYNEFRWHASCFVCSTCKSSLSDTPFTIQDKTLVCQNCIKTGISEQVSNVEEEQSTTTD